MVKQEYRFTKKRSLRAFAGDHLEASVVPRRWDGDSCLMRRSADPNRVEDITV